MTKIEKIALVFFPINDVGGIITWNQEIQKGLNNLGVQTILLYATAGSTYKCDPDHPILKERYTQLPGYHLSFNAANIKQSIDILNQFDAVIFTKVSPHPTKANMEFKDINNWKLLYTEVKVPKVVVFHDALWEKTNGWCAEIAEHVDICIAAQKKFLKSVEAYPANCLKYYDFFPMDFASIDKLDLHQKQNFGMVATQWIKWKNHHKLLPMMPKIKFPIYVYGAGMEWHYLKNTPEYKQAFFKDERRSLILNPNSPHHYWGQMTYPLLQEHYALAAFSLDLSTRGYTNYTHFEPLAYRAISMIERHVLDDPDNIIPEDCCFVYDLEELPRQINWFHERMQRKQGFKIDFKSDPILTRTRDNGQKFIRQADCKFVAQRLINHIKNL